jgi:5-methylthioadenosine/S-adenosylhomocysteine deaminase
MRILTAEHVVPISIRPIRDGAVAIEGDRIAGVGVESDLRRRYPAAVVSDFGNAAILPGLVNCHSHLEISAMRGYLDQFEQDFTGWLLTLNGVRQRMLENDLLSAAALSGAVEGARAGLTCFGDVGRFGEFGLAALKKIGLRGMVFQETEFSPDDRTANEDFTKLRERFEQLAHDSTSLVTVGLSPHSTYTVGPRFLQLIAKFAASHDIRLSIHTAESAEEHELITRGTGFFTSVYEKFGVSWKSPHATPVEYLDRCGILECRPLLVHCVTASEGDIELIATRRATVAHCPKSNAKLGHGAAPFEQMIGCGIDVGLGSDSVASNNVCDLLEEARFAALTARNRNDRNRYVTAAQALEAATLGGAKALGLADEIGTLEEGKAADLAVVSLAHPALGPISDVEAALVFSANARDVVMTMVAGREVYADGTVLGADEAEWKVDFAAALSDRKDA